MALYIIVSIAYTVCHRHSSRTQTRALTLYILQTPKIDLAELRFLFTLLCLALAGQTKKWGNHARIEVGAGP